MTTPDSRQSISPETGQAPASKTAPHSSQRSGARIPLRTELIIAFLAVTLIPLVLLSYLNDRATRQALTEAANEKLKAAAEQTRDSIDSFIQTNLSTIQTEARLPGLIDYLNLPSDQQRNSSQEIQALTILRTFSSKSSNISSYALLDRRGLDVLDTYAADIDLNKFTSDFFQKPLETQQPYASPLRFSATTGELVLYFSTPVENAGEVIGILAVRYKAEALQQLVTQKADLVGKGSFAVLLDEDHIRLADGAQQQMAFKAVVPLAPDRLAALKADGRLPDLLPEELATDLAGFEQGLAQTTEQQPYFAAELHNVGEGLKQSAVAKTVSQPWIVVFAQPQEVFLAPLAEQTNTTVAVVLMIAVVVTVVAVGLAQLLTGPIIHLTTIASQVAAGNLAIQAHVRSRNETGVLAVTFNSMTDQLRNLVNTLEDRVEARTQQLRASAEVSRIVTSILEPDQLLKQVAELITERFGFYYAAVFTPDETNQVAVLRAATGEAGRVLLERGHRLPVNSESMVGTVILTHRARIALDVGEGAVRFANPLLPHTRSEIALPLRVGNRALGALDVQSEQAGAFDEASAQVLQTMADQIAVALLNAETFSQEQIRAQQNTALLQASISLSGITDQSELQARVIDLLAQLLHADGAGLWLPVGNNELELKSTNNTNLIGIAGRRLKIGEGLSGQVYATGAALQVDDYSTWSNRSEAFADAPVRAAMAVPLVLHGKTAGVLLATHSKPNQIFTATDENTARLFAAQAASAIEVASLLEQQRRTLTELDKANRRLTGEAWTQYMKTVPGGYQRQAYHTTGSSKDSQQENLPEIDLAMSAKQPSVWSRPDIAPTDNPHVTGLAAPIILRGEVLGALQVGEENQTRVWTPDEQSFIQAIADQVALALDNARLLEETERRAQRERLVAEVSSRMFASNDLESIIQIAGQELGRVLRVDRAEIKIDPNLAAPLSEPAQPDGNGHAADRQA